MSTDLFDRYAALDPADELSAAPEWQQSDALVFLAAIDERTKTMQTDERTTMRIAGPPRRQRRLWAVAAALGVVALVGVAALVLPPSNGGPASDALAVKDAYFAAYEAGNIDGMLALFSPGIDMAVRDVSEDQDWWGSLSLESWKQRYVWQSAEGTVLTTPECTTSDGPEGDVIVTCEYAHHRYPDILVGAPATSSTLTLTISPDGTITQWRDVAHFPAWVTEGPLLSWMIQTHPADAHMVSFAGTFNSVEQARERGLARAEYAEEWAAFLEESECAFDDLDCMRANVAGSG